MGKFDEIYFEIRVRDLKEDVEKFKKYLPEDGSEPSDIFSEFTYQAWCFLNKSGDDERVGNVKEFASTEREYHDVYVPKNRTRKNHNRNDALAKKHMKSITWTGATATTANKKGVKRCGKNHESFDWKKYDSSVKRLNEKSEILRYNSEPGYLFISDVHDDEDGRKLFEKFEKYVAEHPALEISFSEWYENTYYSEKKEAEYYSNCKKIYGDYYKDDPKCEEDNVCHDECSDYKAFIKEYNLEKLYNHWKKFH